jgi:hypothetical protein
VVNDFTEAHQYLRDAGERSLPATTAIKENCARFRTATHRAALPLAQWEGRSSSTFPQGTARVFRSPGGVLHIRGKPNARLLAERRHPHRLEHALLLAGDNGPQLCHLQQHPDPPNRNRPRPYGRESGQPRTVPSRRQPTERLVPRYPLHTMQARQKREWDAIPEFTRCSQSISRANGQQRLCSPADVSVRQGGGLAAGTGSSSTTPSTSLLSRVFERCTPPTLHPREGWNEAVDNPGRVGGTAVLATDHQRYFHHVAKGTLTMRSSGGYFRSMKRRAHEREIDQKPNSANSDSDG